MMDEGGRGREREGLLLMRTVPLGIDVEEKSLYTDPQLVV